MPLPGADLPGYTQYPIRVRPQTRLLIIHNLSVAL